MRASSGRIQGRCYRRIAGLAVLILLLAGQPATAWAHKVTVFAWVEGDTVHTESKFSGGRPAKEARIEVYDSQGQKLLEGRTDDQGRFVFTPPRPEALRVVLMAGSGHRNEWRVAAEEFAAGSAPNPKDPPVSPAAASPEEAPAQGDTPSISLSKAELQAALEAALDKKLAPLLLRLGSLTDGPKLSDIVGGIGYIIGLVGLAAYLNARRRSG